MKKKKKKRNKIWIFSQNVRGYLKNHCTKLGIFVLILMHSHADFTNSIIEHLITRIFWKKLEIIKKSFALAISMGEFKTVNATDWIRQGFAPWLSRLITWLSWMSGVYMESCLHMYVFSFRDCHKSYWPEHGEGVGQRAMKPVGGGHSDMQVSWVVPGFFFLKKGHQN